MANFKRKKSKRNVRCTICTVVRWYGNSKGRRKDKEDARRKEMRAEALAENVDEPVA